MLKIKFLLIVFILFNSALFAEEVSHQSRFWNCEATSETHYVGNKKNELISGKITNSLLSKGDKFHLLISASVNKKTSNWEWSVNAGSSELGLTYIANNEQNCGDFRKMCASRYNKLASSPNELMDIVTNKDSLIVLRNSWIETELWNYPNLLSMKRVYSNEWMGQHTRVAQLTSGSMATLTTNVFCVEQLS